MGLVETIRRWQAARMQVRELEALGYQEVEHLARDIGLPEDVLLSLASHGPEAGAELSRLMKELSLDAEAIGHSEQALMRDMSVACSGCQEAGYCRRDLDEGRAAGAYLQYCPNGETLQSLQVQHSS